MKEATEWLEMAWAECKERDPQIAYRLGQIFMKMEMYKKAIRHFKASLKLQAKDQQ